MYLLKFDGLFHKAPGFPDTSGYLGFGWLIYKFDQRIAFGYGLAVRGFDATSNVAEYLALIDGLEMLVDLMTDNQPIWVVGDAKGIINRMKGIAGISSERDRCMHRKAQRIAQQLNIITWDWMPRRYNKDADALSRRGLKELRSQKTEFGIAKKILAREYQAKRNQLHYLAGMQVVQHKNIESFSSTSSIRGYNPPVQAHLTLPQLIGI
jgi:ribonuclease HI